MRLNLTTQPSYPALNPLLPRRRFCPLEWADSTWTGIVIALKSERRVMEVVSSPAAAFPAIQSPRLPFSSAGGSVTSI